MTHERTTLATLRWPGSVVPAHPAVPHPATPGVAETLQRHPRWCAQGHRCTADRLPEGEHVSIPEMWQTPLGRLIGTRYRSRDGQRDWIEIRAAIRLDPTNEPTAHQQARVAIAAVHLALTSLTDNA